MPSTILSLKDKVDSGKLAAIDRGAPLMQVPVKPDPVQTDRQQQFNDPEELVNIGDDGDVISTAAPAKPEPVAKPVTEPAKPAESEKVEEKESEGFELPEDPTTQLAKVAPKPATVPTGPRNYDQYAEELRPVLRAFNNSQFAQFAPVLKKLHADAKRTAELEARVGQAPQFFYEHPEAYRIAPEFTQLQNESQYIQFEQNHYTEQLARIRGGEAYQELLGYDKNTGQPLFKEIPPPEDGKPDYRVELGINQQLQRLTALGMQNGQRLAGFQAQYQQSRQKVQTEMDEIDKRLFPAIKSVDDLPPEDKKYYKIAEDITPIPLRGHPLVQPLAKSYVMYMRLLRMYKTAVDMIKKQEGVAADAIVAEPTNIPNGGGVKKPIKPGEIDPDEEVKLGPDAFGD
jgi:hypothetical protein